MYRNIHEYELRYTDFDAWDNLKLSSLLSVLEESACFSADELGFGYNVIKPLDIGFILANWYIEFIREVKLGEKLTVHTWPVKPKNTIFLRDFELYVNGEKVGVASSRWCMIDTKSFNILPVSTFFKKEDLETYNTERSVQFSSWKIPKITDGAECGKRKIALSDYDHYNHMNNTKYADVFIDAFDYDELKGKKFKSFQITYSKQCKCGDTVCLTRKLTETGAQVDGAVDGEPRFQIKVEFYDL